MKKQIILCGLLLYVFSFTTANAQSITNRVKKEWGQTVQGYALSISTEKTTYAPNEPITLRITLKNIGPEDVFVVISDPTRFYANKINVLLPNKNPAPLTLFGSMDMKKHSAGVISTNLKPEEEQSSEIQVSRMFDFSLSGAYEISVTRKIRNPKDNSQWLDVTSNQIKVVVDENMLTKS